MHSLQVHMEHSPGYITCWDTKQVLLFEKSNKIDKYLARLIKKKKRIGLKSIKLKMQKKLLQQTPQKYKGSYETTISNYLAIKWTNYKKWANS